MLAVPILTPINAKDKILLAGSPINFNLRNLAQTNLIQKVEVNIYIWKGLQTADRPLTPQIVYLNLKKISKDDSYIAIEISSEVKSFITASNLNLNNPQYSYNLVSNATTVGEGVYVHIVYKVDAETDVQMPTYFATSGYRLNSEKKGVQYTDFIDAETYRKFAKSIYYSKSSFNFTTVVATSQSNSGTNGIIKTEQVIPIEIGSQTGVSCMIAYINRLGLWDTFTPFGKVTDTLSGKNETVNLAFRNPLGINTEIHHLQTQNVVSASTKYSINTGLLDERNNYQILELLFSPKRYLIFFGDPTFTQITVGLTVDNTIISVDSILINVSQETITIDDIGLYSTFRQIPIKMNTDSILKKTRLNDKSSISYTLEIEEVNNYISNI